MSHDNSFLFRFRTILVQSALFAAIGSVLGYGYAQLYLPPELFETQPHLRGGYALAGAAVGIITLRLGRLARTMIQDYRNGS